MIAKRLFVLGLVVVSGLKLGGQPVSGVRGEARVLPKDPPPGMSASGSVVPEYRHRGFTPEEIAGLSLPPYNTRIGANAPLPPHFVEQGLWSFTPSGQAYWHVRVRSDGAKGVRVHFTNFSVGLGKVWVHGVAGTSSEYFGPYQGRGILESGEFWTELVTGDALEVEYQPAVASRKTVPFEISELFHMWKDLTVTGSVSHLDTSCYLDANCGYLATTDLSNEADTSVALAFSDHTCSGTLMTDRAHNPIPYLLSAGHCFTKPSDFTSVFAVFQLRTNGCKGPVIIITDANQVPGATHIIGHFKPGSKAGSVDLSEPDFELARLPKYPGVRYASAGWDPNPRHTGDVVYSFSYPYYNPLIYADGQITDLSLPNFMRVGWRHGVTDHGSSGSGMYDNAGHLFGIDSGGQNDDGTSACSLTNPDATATKFSAIYATLAPWLDPKTPPPPPTVTFTANPNPIQLAAGATTGQTTLSWNAQGHSRLVIRLKSATGTAMTGTLGSSGSTKTGTWVSDGLQFFLVDLDSNQSLANLTVHTKTSGPPPSTLPTFTASPNPIVVTGNATAGQTTLSWNAPGYSRLVIRLKSVSGTAMTGTLGSSGSAKTGNWVTNGLKFVLVDLDSGNEVDYVIVQVTGGGTPPPTQGLTFTANPNPIVLTGSATTGQTTLTWNAPGYSELQITVNGKAISGKLGTSGSITTGNWVTDGMTFYLVDYNSGGAIAQVTVRVTGGGLPPPSISFTANPNPIVLPPGQSVGVTTLTWNAPGHAPLSIHVGSAYGSVMTSHTGSSGSQATGNWVTDGMSFYLVEDNTGTVLSILVVGVVINLPPIGDGIVGTYSAATEVLDDGVSTPAIRSSSWCTNTPQGTYSIGDARGIPNSTVKISKLSGGFYSLYMTGTDASLPTYPYKLTVINSSKNSMSLGGDGGGPFAFSTAPWVNTNGIEYFPQAFPYLTFTRNAVTGRTRVVAFNSNLPYTYSFQGTVPAQNGYCETTFQDDVLFNYFKDN